MAFNMETNYEAAITAGRHVFQITKIDLRKTKPTGKFPNEDMIVLTLTIVDPQDNARDEQVDEYIVLVNKAWGYGKMQKICKAIDPKMKGVAQVKGGFDPHDLKSAQKHLLGKLLVAVTTLEESAGNDGRVFFNARCEDFYALTKSEREAIEQHYDGQPKLPEKKAPAPERESWANGKKGSLPSPEGELFDDGFSEEEIPF